MLEMLQPLFKRKNQPTSKPTIKILISSCLGLRKVEELQTQLVTNLHHRLGHTVDIVCLERDLGGSHMLHVEINGRCVLRRETIRDADSQNIPYFIQGFLSQQADEQIPWQPKLEYDYLVLGSTGMHSYFSETQRDREPKPEQSEQPQRLDSSVAESEAKETPVKKCRSHHSRIRELKSANKPGQVSKPINNSYTANPHRRDQDASSSKEHSPTAILQPQTKGQMQANLISPQTGKLSRASPFKQLGKIVPSFERLQSPMRNTANKENSLKPLGKSSHIIRNPLLKQSIESKPTILKDSLKKKQSLESPEPKLKLVDRKQDSLKNPAQIQSSETSPKRPASTCAVVSAPKFIKPSLFRNPPSAVESTKLKELGQSKIIRFKGNRPIAHRQIGKQQAANSQQSKQNIAVEQSLPGLATSTPASNELSQCELPIKHCTVFQDLTLGTGSPTELQEKSSLNIPVGQRKQEGKPGSEEIEQSEQGRGSGLLESAKEGEKPDSEDHPRRDAADPAVEKGQLVLESEVKQHGSDRSRSEQSAHDSRASLCPPLEVMSSKASLAVPAKECVSAVKSEGVSYQQMDYGMAAQQNAQVDQYEQHRPDNSSASTKPQVIVQSSTELNANTLANSQSESSCQQVDHQKVRQEVNEVADPPVEQRQISQGAMKFDQQQLSEATPSPAAKQHGNPCSLPQTITAPAPLAQKSQTAVLEPEFVNNPPAPPAMQTNKQSSRRVVAATALGGQETDGGTLQRSSIVQSSEQPPATSTQVASEALLHKGIEDTIPASNQRLEQVVQQPAAIPSETNVQNYTTDVPALLSYTQDQTLLQVQATQATAGHQAPQSTEKSVTSEVQQEQVASSESEAISGSLQRESAHLSEGVAVCNLPSQLAAESNQFRQPSANELDSTTFHNQITVASVIQVTSGLLPSIEQESPPDNQPEFPKIDPDKTNELDTYQQQEKVLVEAVPQQSARIATYKSLSDNFLPSGTSIMNRYKSPILGGGLYAGSDINPSQYTLDVGTPVGQQGRIWSNDDDSGKALEELYGYCMGSDWHSPSEDRVYMSSSKSGSQAQRSSMKTQPHREQIMQSNGEELLKQSKNDTLSEEKPPYEPENRSQTEYTSPSGQIQTACVVSESHPQREVIKSSEYEDPLADGKIPKEESLRQDKQPQKDQRQGERTTPAVEDPTNTIESITEVEHSPPIIKSINQSNSLESGCEVKETGTVKQDTESKKPAHIVQQTFQPEGSMGEQEADPVSRKNQQPSKPQVDPEQVRPEIDGNEEIKSKTHCQCDHEGQKDETTQPQLHLPGKAIPLGECMKGPDDELQPASLPMVEGTEDERQGERSSKKQTPVSAAMEPPAATESPSQPLIDQDQTDYQECREPTEKSIGEPVNTPVSLCEALQNTAQTGKIDSENNGINESSAEEIIENVTSRAAGQQPVELDPQQAEQSMPEAESPDCADCQTDQQQQVAKVNTTGGVSGVDVTKIVEEPIALSTDKMDDLDPQLLERPMDSGTIPEVHKSSQPNLLQANKPQQSDDSHKTEQLTAGSNSVPAENITSTSQQPVLPPQEVVQPTDHNSNLKSIVASKDELGADQDHPVLIPSVKSMNQAQRQEEDTEVIHQPSARDNALSDDQPHEAVSNQDIKEMPTKQAQSNEQPQSTGSSQEGRDERQAQSTIGQVETPDINSEHEVGTDPPSLSNLVTGQQEATVQSGFEQPTNAREQPTSHQPSRDHIGKSGTSLPSPKLQEEENLLQCQPLLDCQKVQPAAACPEDSEISVKQSQPDYQPEELMADQVSPKLTSEIASDGVQPNEQSAGQSNEQPQEQQEIAGQAHQNGQTVDNTVLSRGPLKSANQIIRDKENITLPKHETENKQVVRPQQAAQQQSASYVEQDSRQSLAQPSIDMTVEQIGQAPAPQAAGNVQSLRQLAEEHGLSENNSNDPKLMKAQRQGKMDAADSANSESPGPWSQEQDEAQQVLRDDGQCGIQNQPHQQPQPTSTAKFQKGTHEKAVEGADQETIPGQKCESTGKLAHSVDGQEQVNPIEPQREATSLSIDKESEGTVPQQLASDVCNTQEEGPIDNTDILAEESMPKQPIHHTPSQNNKVMSTDREVDEGKQVQKNIGIKEVEQIPISKEVRLSETQQQNKCSSEQVQIGDYLKQDTDIDRSRLCEQEVRAHQQVEQVQVAGTRQGGVSSACPMEEPSISNQDSDEKGMVKSSAVKSQFSLTGQAPVIASQDINAATLEGASVVQAHQQLPPQRQQQVPKEDKCSDGHHPIRKSGEMGMGCSISNPIAAAPASLALDSVLEDSCIKQCPQYTQYEPKSSNDPIVQDHLEISNTLSSESSLPASIKLLPENSSQSRKTLGSRQVILAVQDCPQQATSHRPSHQSSQQKSPALISPQAAQPFTQEDLGNGTQPSTLERKAQQQEKQPQPVHEGRNSRNESTHQESSITNHPSLRQQNQDQLLYDSSAVAESKNKPFLKHESQTKLANTGGAEPESNKMSRTRIKAATSHIGCAPKQFTPRILVQSAYSLPGDHPIPSSNQVPSTNKKLRLKQSIECIENLPRTSRKDIPAPIPTEHERLYTADNHNVETKDVACSTANFQLEQPRLSNRELQHNGPDPRRQRHQRASTDESFTPEHKIAQHESTRLSDNTIPLSNKNFTKSGTNNQSQRHSSQRQSQPRQRIIQEESEEASSEPQQHSQQASQPKSNEPVIIIINSGSACQPSPSMLDHQAMRNYAATMAQQQFVVNHHGPSAQDASRRVSIKEARSQQNRERYSGNQDRADHRRGCPDTSRKVLLENLDISQILNNTNEPVPFLPTNINSKGHDSIEEPSRSEDKLNQQQAEFVEEQGFPPEQVQKPVPPKRPSLGIEGESKQLLGGDVGCLARPAGRTKAIPQKRTSAVAKQPPETNSKTPNIFDRQAQKQYKQPSQQQPKEAEIYSRILSRNTIERFESTLNVPVREPFTLVDAKHRSFPREFHCSVKDDNLADFDPNPSFSYTVNLIHGLSDTFLPGLFRNYPKIGATSINYLWSGTWKTVTSPSTALVAAKDISQQDASLLACLLEKSIHLYQKKQQMSITFVDDYFQTLTGCPLLRFPLSQLTPAKTWAMLTQLTNNKKGTHGTRQLLLAVPSSPSDLPFTVLKVEQYQNNKLVQLKGCNSVEPVLMEFDRFCSAFRRVSVGYFNPQFYYSTMPVAIASKVISIGIVAHDTAAIYFWLHEDKELLPYKLCLYLEFEPKKFRFVGEKSFKKTGRLFNATIRGRYLLLLEHKQPTKSDHILCCCSTSLIEMRVQSNEFQRTQGGGYENQGVVLLPVQLEH